MTADERAGQLGDVFERQGEDCHVQVWRSDIADAIRAASEETRERCALAAEGALADEGTDDPHRALAWAAAAVRALELP